MTERRDSAAALGIELPAGEELRRVVDDFGRALGVRGLEAEPVAPAARPRVRDVESSGSHWLEHPDGTVERVEVRRIGAAEGRWSFTRFRAPTRAAALRQRDSWLDEQLERTTRQAARRQRWGIQEQGA